MKNLIQIIYLFGLAVLLASCASQNLDEVKQLAEVSFKEQNYIEFSKQLNILFNENEETAIKYFEEIKSNELFNITKTSNPLKTKKIYEAISSNVPKLSDFADEELLYLNYRDDLNKITSSIESSIFKKASDPLHGINKIMLLLDSPQEVKNVLEDYDQMLNGISGIMLELEAVKIPEEKLKYIDSLTKELIELEENLMQKRNYIDKNKVDIIANNKQLLEGNLIATLNSKELNGEYDIFSNEIKRNLTKLEQRIRKVE